MKSIEIDFSSFNIHLFAFLVATIKLEQKNKSGALNPEK